MDTSLSQRLIRAREQCGLSLYEAAGRMPDTSYQTLWHLEGRAKGKKPAAGPDVALKTAVDIVSTYWPEIQLTDFMPLAKSVYFESLQP